MLQDIWLWMVESEAWQTVPIHFSLKRRGCQSSECVQIVTCPRHPKTKTQRQNCSDNELRMHLITLNIFLFIKPDWPVGIHNSHRGTVADSSGDTNRGTKLWGLPKWFLNPKHDANIDALFGYGQLHFWQMRALSWHVWNVPRTAIYVCIRIVCVCIYIILYNIWSPPV